MPPSDLDITRTAHLLIQQRGAEATAKARQKVDEMRRRGDADGGRVAADHRGDRHARHAADERAALTLCM
jgi:hypothetical protein